MAIGPQPGLAVLAVSALLLAAACSPAPSPSRSPSAFPSQSAPRTPSATPASSELAAVFRLPVGQLAEPPPTAVQAWLFENAMGTVFRPLTDSELTRVRITAAMAEQIALAEPDRLYGPDGSTVVWTRVGCIFLGYYRGPGEPTHGQYVAPSEFPAYLVQVIGAPTPGLPRYMNVAGLVINAETGQPVGGPGSSEGAPVLGTTCGVAT